MSDNSTATFNEVYDKPDFYYGREVRPEFVEFVQKRSLRGRLGLDLGCGEGRYSLYLARRGCRVTGIDRSEAGLTKLEKIARRERLPVTTRQLDVADFDYPEDAYDIVVAATILDHLDETARRRTIAGLKKTVKPSGIVYINVFTEADPGAAAGESGGESSRNSTGENTGLDHAGRVSDTAGCMAYYFAPEELKTLFDDWKIQYYYEGLEPDLSHGQPHYHGWACLLAIRPAESADIRPNALDRP
ncbi:MAG: methyltransferase domain-containing protein [Desulfosudaceae bacterium]